MSVVEELEQSIDIVELVSKYAKLKKSGTSYKALCPFPGHSEKTPSFVVSPAKQIAYCFGCHKGGWALKFLMDMENCDFREAVQILGNILWREVQGYSEKNERYEIQKNIYSLYKDALSFYKKSLWEHPEIQKYLFDRGINQTSIQEFQFGYASDGVALYNTLKEKGYSDELIFESHIFQDLKKRRDYFIGRLIFPIQNLRGDIVAFAGRIIGAGEPKYLNSPASLLYDKSSLLYGLYFARKSIHERDMILITEGYMDTISLHQAGFKQTVAISWTALTEKHIPLITRLTKKVYLCLDNDTAGKKATFLALETLKNKGLEVRIIQLPEWQKDPDEFIKSGGDFENCIKEALSPIAFSLKHIAFDEKSIDEKKKFIREILQTIESYSDSIERDMYLKELSQKSNTPISLLYEMFQQKRQEKVSAEKQEWQKQTTSEDIAYGYIFLSEVYQKMFQDACVLEDYYDEAFHNALYNRTLFLSSLTFEKESYIKALSFQIEEKNLSESEHENNIKKIATQIDKNIVKIRLAEYASEMKSGKSESLEKYSRLLEKAKQHNLK